MRCFPRGASTCLGGAIRDPLSGRAYVYQAIRVTGSGNPLETVEHHESEETKEYDESNEVEEKESETETEEVKKVEE